MGKGNYIGLLDELALGELLMNAQIIIQIQSRIKDATLNRIFVLNPDSHLCLTHLELESRCTKLGTFQTISPKVLIQLPKGLDAWRQSLTSDKKRNQRTCIPEL